MKHTLILVACLFTLPLSAQDADPGGPTTGMTFAEKSFDDLLAQAKAEDKIIFIDAYTTWCGPCKMMAKKVFPAEAVGKVYNERFINAKFDMEKGEGPGLARRYGVQAYPTYLFVDGNGEIIHKGIGYIPQEAFLALADAASGENSLGALNKRYANGERSTEFLRAYATTLDEVYESQKASEVTGLYLDRVDDWSDVETMKMLVQNPGELGGKRMNYLVENADVAMRCVGATPFLMAVQQAIVGKYMKDNQLRQLPEGEQIAPLYAKYAAPLKDRLLAHYGVLKAQQSHDTKAYIAAALPYYTEYPGTDATELNRIAWDVYENVEDKAQLLRGLELAKQSVALEAGYPNLYTLAWLYQKIGNHKMAVKTAEQAIARAKESGTDYSDTERLLSLD